MVAKALIHFIGFLTIIFFSKHFRPLLDSSGNHHLCWLKVFKFVCVKNHDTFGARNGIEMLFNYRNVATNPLHPKYTPNQMDR